MSQSKCYNSYKVTTASPNSPLTCNFFNFSTLQCTSTKTSFSSSSRRSSVSRGWFRASPRNRRNNRNDGVKLRRVRHRSREFHSPFSERDRKPMKSVSGNFWKPWASRREQRHRRKHSRAHKFHRGHLRRSSRRHQCGPSPNRNSVPWKEQAKEIVVLQQPTKAAPPEIRRIVVPPPVPAEANEPGTWIEQAQTAAATKIAIARTDDQPSVRASADTIWKQALRSPNAARTAIILREIFGPPRGVQSSNFVFETP